MTGNPPSLVKDLHDLLGYPYLYLMFYKLISNYGFSIVRPCIFFFLLIIVFAFSYYFTSMSPNVDPWENSLKASIQVASLTGMDGQ